MKKISLFVLTSLLFFASCSDEETGLNTSTPKVSIENLSNVTEIAQGDTLYLKAHIVSELESSIKWVVDDLVDEASRDSVFKFVADELGNYTINLYVSNLNGEASASVSIDVYGKYKHGTFVLNEGNMTTESGSLIFISPQGIITDSVYYKENGSFLGNTSQDLCIVDGKIYIVAQNGGDDGKLVVANAETLKKEASFNDELSALSWPTHVAVLEGEVFIRDNNGVHSFNTQTKVLTLVKNTKGALKNRMAMVNNKVFVPAKNSLLVLEAGKQDVSHTIALDAPVSGVIKTSDGNIYVSTTGTPNKIVKISASDYSVIKENEITEGKVGAGFGATPGISAKGDTIYYSNAGTQIYRHIFSTQESALVANVKDYVENANIVYNNLAVNPVTGEVYFNSIKGYGWDYLINNISVFNFSEKEPKLVNNYKNYTNFPAGIFFTDNFK